VPPQPETDRIQNDAARLHSHEREARHKSHERGSKTQANADRLAADSQAQLETRDMTLNSPPPHREDMGTGHARLRGRRAEALRMRLVFRVWDETRADKHRLTAVSPAQFGMQETRGRTLNSPSTAQEGHENRSRLTKRPESRSTPHAVGSRKLLCPSDRTVGVT